MAWRNARFRMQRVCFKKQNRARTESEGALAVNRCKAQGCVTVSLLRRLGAVTRICWLRAKPCGGCATTSGGNYGMSGTKGNGA